MTTPNPSPRSKPERHDLANAAVRIIARVACGDLAHIGEGDLVILADLARRMANTPSPTVTHVQVLALDALAHAPTAGDRATLAAYLRSQSGRQTLAHAFADARRDLAATEPNPSPWSKPKRASTSRLGLNR